MFTTLNEVALLPTTVIQTSTIFHRKCLWDYPILTMSPKNLLFFSCNHYRFYKASFSHFEKLKWPTLRSWWFVFFFFLSDGRIFCVYLSELHMVSNTEVPACCPAKDACLPGVQTSESLFCNGLYQKSDLITYKVFLTAFSILSHTVFLPYQNRCVRNQRILHSHLNCFGDQKAMKGNNTCKPGHVKQKASCCLSLL